MLRKYEMELDELKHPLMVEESSYECPDERLNSPEKIVRILNKSFTFTGLPELSWSSFPAAFVAPSRNRE